VFLRIIHSSREGNDWPSVILHSTVFLQCFHRRGFSGSECSDNVLNHMSGHMQGMKLETWLYIRFKVNIAKSSHSASTLTVVPVS